ncbi:MAG TPA: DUF4129 domain-containing protein [Bryobacteraceae bacterium]|nr:DUF4129 domain-containing protein [Bryobacteraceae bacterium]
MKTAAEAPGAIALLDAAFDLLHAAPASAWLIWAAGGLPFGLGVIAFVSEMTSSADPARLLPAHALALAVLFLWMVACQAMFTQRLWPLLSGTPRPRPALVAQVALGGTSLLMLPLAALSLFGFHWMMAFYYGATAAAARDLPGIARYASRQASTWSLASIVELMVAFLLGLVVFVNVLTLLIGGPVIYRTLTGEETVFTTNAAGIFTSTLFAAAFVITWLLMDPLLRAAFVVRCFRVDAIRTGVDLKATVARYARAALVLLLIVLPLRATQLSVEPRKLDHSIREVTRRPEFVWREQRPVGSAPSSNAFMQFTADAIRFIGDNVRRALDWIGDVVRAIMRWLIGQRGGDLPDASAARNVPFAAPMLYILIAIAAGAIIALLLRLRLRRRQSAPLAAATATAELNLESDDVSPDQAPEDAWLAMAARLFDAGDLRLATRALYLAVLASLGENRLITIHRARSNMDYQRELARRARGNAILVQKFRGLVAVFERTWYGDHPMSREAFAEYQNEALETRARGQA